MLLEPTEDITDPIWLLAAREAKKSSLRYKLGAVIKYKNRIAKGYNSLKTHPYYGSGRWQTMHAESSAIYSAIKAGINLKGSTMYVYRHGGLRSKPCKDCQELIRKHGIKKVIYTDCMA